MRAGLAAAAIAAIALAPRLGAQEPSLDTVMARAAAYVTGFQRQLSTIVAEETYVQDARKSTGRMSSGRFTPSSPNTHRELRSDLLLVWVNDRYVDFRDVFEVDGRRVRDRQERLTSLFLDPSASANTRFRQVIDESARYNIGSVERNVNTPTLPLVFLSPSYQKRVRFNRVAGKPPAIAGSSGKDSSSANFVVSTEVWVVEFRETGRDTLIRSRGDLPARGRFWIESETGRVLMSELLLDAPTVSATIDVSYQSEPLVGFLVPIEMRERYTGKMDRAIIEGVATYGKFRQFQVKTSEQLVPISPKP